MKDLSREYADLLKKRKDFPSLERTHNGLPLAFLDGPGGTQVPRQVIDAIAGYYTTCNTNTHGFFVTSRETDRILEDTREKLATFLGAENGSNISYGQSMTTLCYSLSRAVGRYLQPGDEILITQLDHEANRGPWLALRDQGLVVREVRLKPNGTLDYDDFQDKINERTRLVAMGYSSNVIGTVNDVALVRELTYRVGAWLLVDAVHYAPHFPINVQSSGIDFLLCSAYKFYGPHVGILYAKTGLLNRLPCDSLRTQEQQAPWCIETGTLNHAAIAGVNAAIDYIATFGTGDDLRARLVTAMQRIGIYEEILATDIHTKLGYIPGTTLIGPSPRSSLRAPTVSFTVEGMDPIRVCTLLGEKGICAWNGHFYGIRPIERLGLLEKGGVTRIGISLYNTQQEVGRLIDAMKIIAGG